MTAPEDENDVLRPREIAEMFRVEVRTISKWYREGKLPKAFKTPGGILRMRRKDVEDMLKPEQ